MSAEFVAHMEDVLDLYAEPYDPKRPVSFPDDPGYRLSICGEPWPDPSQFTAPVDRNPVPQITIAKGGMPAGFGVVVVNHAPPDAGERVIQDASPISSHGNG